ncbi:MAG: 5'-3' exonuclease H3TH domain-containing protein, partial [Actinomycetota bacterium]
EQFEPLEEGLRALGVEVWPMIEFEADDALAAGAVMASADARVSKVLICTPDKDLAQCVGGKVFQWDRRKDFVFDSSEVHNKYGVFPSSIPDYLALVGDSADGFPGLAGWGQKSSATLLNHYGSIEMIPDESDDWDVTIRGGRGLAATLTEHRDRALLFKEIATVRTDAPVAKSVEDLQWKQPAPNFEEFCSNNRMEALVSRIEKLLAHRI